MNYIILNDVNSNTIQGLLIQNLPPITKPKIRTNIEEIDGKDGDIITKLGYSAYDKEFDIGLYGNYDVDQVISYFNSEGTVIFSNEDDKFYKYTIIEQIDFERLIRFKTAKVKMHVQPFKYSNTDTDIEIYATETDAEGTNLTINNTENGASFLDMQLKGQTTQDGTPTPSAPVNVNVVTGNTSVKICNKNRLKNSIQSQTLNGITITRNSDGTLLINGTATANTYFDFSTNFDTTKYAGYKFYGFPDNPGFFIRISKSNRVALQDISSNGTVISNNGTGNHIAIRIAGGSNVNNRLLSPMLIAPTETDTTYIEHQEQNYEINLGTIELCEINGYQDYIYKNNGKWYKSEIIGKKNIVGNDITISQQHSGSIYQYRTAIGYISDIITSTNPWSNNLGLSNYFVKNNNVNALDSLGFTLGNNGQVVFNSNETTLTNFKTWVDGVNLLIYYVKNAPIEEEITDENLIAQLEGLRNASTYINQTNIITSGDLAPIIYVNVDTIDTNEIEVVNSGNYYSKPVVTITGIGTINLYLNDYQVFILELGDTETTITLDVENMEAYNINTGQLMNRQVTGDYNNFIFNSGTNIITWSGTIASVQIVNYSRWI